VQEAFVTYMKVSFVAGLIIASPWVFYQLWLFIAAGLYPHERKYIYTYLPMSLVLFLGGVFFCFYAVLPTVLDFLLGFNVRTELTAQIRISEWISFAIMLPLLFGLSFQLPMVMLFLSRINLFTVKQYIAQWKMAVLVIAILSMLLTPTPDPMTMILMMVPLLALYALGIGLCHWTRPKVAVEAAT
jgi:sec-independent protein translocase protein TatC